MAKVLSLDTSNNVVEITVSGGGGMLYRKQVTFTTSQNWTLPSTAHPAVDYDLIGGGGAGGGVTTTTYRFCGGGGGGERKRGTLMLTPGTTYPVTVGAGGASAAVSPGADGGNSVLAGVTARGGKGGTVGEGGAAGDGTPATRRAGRKDVMGFQTATSGGGGAPAVGSSSPYTPSSCGGIGLDGVCSGGGGSAPSGDDYDGAGPGGGAGSTGVGNGGNATSPGSGGGGGLTFASAVTVRGGAGFRGELRITYWDTVP